MKSFQVIAVVFAIVFSAHARGAAPVAWEESFDSPHSLKRAQIYYEDRGSGKINGDAVIIQKLRKGVYRYGLKVDPARPQDRFNLMYGDVCWGKPKPTDLHKLPQNPKAWGPFDLAEFPIVEIRWRGDPFCLWYGVMTAEGKRQTGYVYLKVDRQEVDTLGLEWNVSLFRPAPDIASPQPTTAIKLMGIDLAHYSPDKKDVVTEIDTIRVRGLTPKQEGQQKIIASTLADFPHKQWAGLDTFFPFGVYTVGTLHNFAESWGGSYQGAYGTYVRHHFNYTPMGEIELGRSAGDDLGTSSWPAATDRYIRDMQPMIAAARATGMRLGADVRHLLRGRDASDGYMQVVPIARRVANAFDDEIIVSWFASDEPKLNDLLRNATIIRAMRTADPFGRPEVVALNSADPDAISVWARFLNVICWDLYPISSERREPWRIRTRARACQDAAPNKPMWAILQSFESRPPTPQGAYARPSEAEMRAMAYMAIAEGAKGLIWYIGWNGYGRDEGLVDRTNLPRGAMMATLSTLAQRLIPIAMQLLATDPVKQSNVQLHASTKPNDGHDLVISRLKHRTDNVQYLVVVNEDLTQPRKTKATLDRNIFKGDLGVYDLYRLDGDNLLKQNDFNIDTLAGGDGRIYAVCSSQDFTKLRQQILCTRALETVRVLTPDLSIAKRWKLPTGKVEAAINQCAIFAKESDGQNAVAQADLAKNLLAYAIENDSELASTRSTLREIQLELAKVMRIAELASDDPYWWTKNHHPAMVPNPRFLDVSKSYWQVGRQYSKHYADYLHGRNDGLWAALSKTRVNCLTMREKVLTQLRKELEPHPLTEQ